MGWEYRPTPQDGFAVKQAIELGTLNGLVLSDYMPKAIAFLTNHRFRKNTLKNALEVVNDVKEWDEEHSRPLTDVEGIREHYRKIEDGEE